MQEPRNRIAALVVISLLIAPLGAGCSDRHQPTPGEGEAEGSGAADPSRAGGRLTIKGSDTMVILAQRWAEAYMETNPEAALQVSGGGSGTGIAALINGTTDIANASRQIKDRERRQLREGRGADAHEVRVALDALAVYVEDSNPVQSLTVPQLKQIFRGQVSNWSEVGGPDRPIVLYSRENSSGTYAYFKEHVLEDEDFAAHAQTLPGTAAVINAVSRDPNGIGYGGIAYAEGVQAIGVSHEGEEPVEPSMENATSGRYPLSRYLHVYTTGEPTGLAQGYIDFALSQEGQSIVEGVGYYPLPSDQGRPSAASGPAQAATTGG